MYYISEYEKNAIKKVIPYLLEFPQIVEIIKVNAGRYQDIEKLLWDIISNFKVNDARGIFLDIIANNEVVDIIYTDKADDAFTYGTNEPLKQAYGTGHFYSQASYTSGSSKNISDDKMIRAVKAKIIQNNTNGTIEDILESLKLYFNATSIGLSEFYPLGTSITLSGKNLEISSSGVYETLKKMLPICVNLNNIYIDDKKYDLFKYSDISSYGYTRYPMVLKDGISKYQYISKSINLNSEKQEYIKTNYVSFNNKLISCIIGQFTDKKNNSTLLNCGDLSIQTIALENDKTCICVKYNENIYSTNIEVNKDNQYEIILYNDNNTLKLWVYEKINISGNLNKDTSYIYSVISNKNPILEIPEFVTTEEAPIYINCENTNEEIMNYGDFTYHAILFGIKEDNNVKLNEYYVTCYGEKHVLFNCLENKNHLEIYTNDDLRTNLTVKQNIFNYREIHSGNRYCYFDGNSGIDYYLSYENTDCSINNIEISFDICSPISINEGVILSNFVGYDNSSYISLQKDGSISITFIKETLSNENNQYIKEIYSHYSDNILKENEYINIKIIIKENNISVYKNNILNSTNDFDGNIYNMPSILKLGYGLNSNFKGIIRNLKFNIDGNSENNNYKSSLQIDLKNELRDNLSDIEYINNGARFISVPQLISDTNNIDIYNNNLTTVR